MVGSQLKSLGIIPESAEEALLKKYVDDSVYSLEEWIEGLQEFQEWCQEKSKPYEATGALEYLHCCAFSARRHPIKPRLWEIVSEMLYIYGWEMRKENC
jgi:hypothetical protein